VTTLDRDDLLALWLDDQAGHREASRHTQNRTDKNRLLIATEVVAFLRNVTSLHGARSLDAVNFVHRLVREKHCSFSMPLADLPEVRSLADHPRRNASSSP